MVVEHYLSIWLKEMDTISYQTKPLENESNEKEIKSCPHVELNNFTCSSVGCFKISEWFFYSICGEICDVPTVKTKDHGKRRVNEQECSQGQEGCVKIKNVAVAMCSSVQPCSCRG